jgi:GT2 family glycosyltransferase
MDVSIVTVSWNVRDLLSRLLDSIFQYTDDIKFEVIIIDNNSKDGTVEHITQNFSQWINSNQLKIIHNDNNAGFAKANNQGLAQAKGKYVCFMNPDMELLENTFKKMKQFMDQSPDVGIATCRLLYPDKTIQSNIKTNPTLCSQIFVLLKLHHFFFWLPCLKKYLQKNFDYTQKQYIEQAMGAFVFTTKSLMSKIEGWNESYWLWWEDVELYKSVQKQNKDIVYLPITEIIHFEGKSFAQTKGLSKQKRFNKGMLHYFSRHHSKLSYFVLYILQPASWFLTIITQLLKIKARPQSRI